MKRKVSEDAPTRVDLKFFGTQHEFVMCEDAYVAFIAGIGSGKTHGGVGKDLLKTIECPGSLGMIGAPTFPMLRDSTLVKLLEIFPERLIETFNEQKMEIHLRNNSNILLRSCDNPDNLRGPSLTWFHFDEGGQMKREAWKIAQGRLRQEGTTIHGLPWTRQGWVTSTPKGYNWVYQEFGLRERPDYKLFHCATRENTHLPEEYLANLLNSYEGQFALQELEGKFVIIGGSSFFNGEVLKNMIDQCDDPVEERLGHTRIWKQPYIGGKYVAGLDPCWGETGSFACLQIMEWQTGEQVAEIHSRMWPDEIAHVSTKLCKEYNNAYLGIEANGEGANVINKCIELGYGDRLYYRDIDGDKAGWYTDDKSRPVLLGEFEEAVRNYQVRLHSRELIDEMIAFIRNERGKPEALEGSYADRIMAFALAWQMRHSAIWYSGATEKLLVNTF